MFQKIDFKQIVAKNKVVVLISSIVTLLLGVLCIITPYAAGAVLIWVFIGLVGLYALFTICRFIFPGKGNKRSPLNLIIGLLLAACVTGIILVGIFAKEVNFDGGTLSGFEATTLRLLGITSIVFGAIAVVENIFLLCSVGRAEKGSRALLVVKSILGLAVGTLLVIFPFVMLMVSMILGGIYLIVVSIFLIAMVISFWGVDSGEDVE